MINDLTMRLADHGISPKATRAPHLRRERELDPAQEQLLLKVLLLSSTQTILHTCLRVSYLVEINTART